MFDGGETMKLLTAAILALSTSALQADGPAYIKCEFKDGNGAPWPVLITADEANGTVTLLFEKTGRVSQMRASFGPELVKFGDGSIDYQLSRVDLKIQRYTAVLRQNDTAQCVLRETPKRAF